MRLKERWQEEITDQTVVGILRMGIPFFGMWSSAAGRLFQFMPVRDLHDEERKHDQKQYPRQEYLFSSFCLHKWFH